MNLQTQKSPDHQKIILYSDSNKRNMLSFKLIITMTTDMNNIHRSTQATSFAIRSLSLSVVDERRYVLISSHNKMLEDDLYSSVHTG